MRKIDPNSAESMEEYEFFRYLQRKEALPPRKKAPLTPAIYVICFAAAAVIFLLCRIF